MTTPVLRTRTILQTRAFIGHLIRPLFSSKKKKLDKLHFDVFQSQNVEQGQSPKREIISKELRGANKSNLFYLNWGCSKIAKSTLKNSWMLG